MMAEGGGDKLPPVPPKSMLGGHGAWLDAAFTRSQENSFTFDSSTVASIPPPLPPRRVSQSVKASNSDLLSKVPPPPSNFTVTGAGDFRHAVFPAVESGRRMSAESLEALFKQNRFSSGIASTHNQLGLFTHQWNTAAPSVQQAMFVTSLSKTEMNHSHSAPNFQEGVSNRTNLSSHFSAVHVGSSSVKQSGGADLNDIFSCLRKKEDSNLIDLPGEDDDFFKKRKSVRHSGNQFDDLLDLFDPLREEKAKCNGENVDIPIQKIDEQNSENHTRDVVIDTVDSEIVEQCTPDDSNDSIEADDAALSVLSRIEVVKQPLTCHEEIQSYWQKVQQLRSDFTHDDHVTNGGLVISSTLENKWVEPLSIKLEIASEFQTRPFTFTCDVGTSIEHVISHTVCSLLDEVSDVSMEDYVLKVRGFAEYFTRESVLKDYEYVHQCHKFDKPVCLTLMHVKDLKLPWARTERDDSTYLDVQPDQLFPHKNSVTFDSVVILLDTFHNEAEKLQKIAIDEKKATQPRAVIQAVKALCAILSQVETLEIRNAVEGLKMICTPVDSFCLSDIDDDTCLVSRARPKNLDCNKFGEVVTYSLLQVQNALRTLLTIYCRSLAVDFSLSLPPTIKTESKEITSFQDTLLIHVATMHQLNPTWLTEYEYFTIICEICYGEKILASVETKKTYITRDFFDFIIFEEWLEFKDVYMRNLPREASLYMTLYGVRTISDSKQSDLPVPDKKSLGWCGLSLFNSKLCLIQGSLLCGFWLSDVKRSTGPSICNPSPSCPLLRINLPEFECNVVFPKVSINDHIQCQGGSFSLDSNTYEEIIDKLEKEPFSVPSEHDKHYFWDMRHHISDIPHLLPKVLLSVQSWSWAYLSDVYSLFKSWKPASPINSLTLLLPVFPDTEVRRTAVQWLKNIGSDELCDHLPQLIQALRFEIWEDSPLVWFLLERSLTSVRVAHQMYWLLQQNLDNPLTHQRMNLVLNTLLVILGKAFRDMIESQESLLKKLSEVADKIKDTRESHRLDRLLQEMESVHNLLFDCPACLPLSPAMEVCGIDVRNCSYFTSKTLPLKILFKSTEAGAKPIESIYKAGDDLRQDMLTLQVIRIMDKFWLKEGLDLKITTFMCVATENCKGIVEVVTEAETLRRIQTEHGLTGSFKDRPIAEWLQKHNTSELEYQQAVDNFTHSCAGYCVATYILGICDRHNDNIMLKTSGHMFHIDFGKFLGDSQMFGNIKRDRAPFVLTSDMVYVINGGDKPTPKFQAFIDTCCQAFNIVRKNSNILLTLFALMVSSGIPGVTMDAVHYVQKSLLLGVSEAEATAYFTRLIEESLKSRFTQLNFFIHNLAQLRFTGDHNDELLLSFVPKTFTQDTDGRISSLEVLDCQKRYDPEKYYTYIIRVGRSHQAQSICVYRTFAEFLELYQKLVRMFPLAKFHPLTKGSILDIRNNNRETAQKRKVEIEVFLKSLMNMAEEVSHCSLVYTFFHPLLRDQEGMTEEELQRESFRKFQQCKEFSNKIMGRIKVSLVYKNNSLCIMIMHAENLSCKRKSVPDTYVKTYLRPDPDKSSKKKTKVVFKNEHPTFMELLVYNHSYEWVRCKMLVISVWDYGRGVQENEFLGSVSVPLNELDLHKERESWHQLSFIPSIY